MKRYNSLNDYLKKRYNKKLYKIALDIGTTCPNRDGTKGTGGCIFCSCGGSGEFAESGSDIKEQIFKAKDRINAKTKGKCGYIAYFQSFTNTYAPIEYLKEKFFSILEDDEIEIISIATRPDCLDEEVLSLLEELNEKIPVWVELGLQTSNENTAQFINRCYTNDIFIEAVQNLKNIGVEVIAHVIIGLPYEKTEDYVNTVKFACDAGINGIKLQLLHVLKNTALEKMNFPTLSMEEYFYNLKECIEVIPPDVVIHRLTGDGDKRQLIAPLWSADKHNVLNSMNRYFEENNVIQGSKRS